MGKVTKRKRRVSKKRKVVRKRRKARKARVGSMRRVFSGTRDRTAGGLKKEHLQKNKRGKVVSRKAHAHGKRIYKKGLHRWTKAFMQARKNLGVEGFKPCKKGTKLYSETMKLYKK